VYFSIKLQNKRTVYEKARLGAKQAVDLPGVNVLREGSTD